MRITHRQALAPSWTPRRLPQAGLLVALALLTGACDATPQAPAGPPDAAPRHAAAVPACPATELSDFVVAFAEDPALQKAFTAPTVETAFVDWDAQPEPAESVEPMSRDALRFPVMPDRARQRADGLQYREIGRDGDRATIVLEVPDTDAQLRYTFRRGACWTLVKIVDPAFGKAFAETGTGGDALSAGAPAAADGRIPQGLSPSLAACMARAGSQDVRGTDCLSEEQRRQDARLNAVYTRLIGHLQGERRERVVAAQRAWVALQEKDAAFEAAILDALGPEGGRQEREHRTLAIAQRADLLVSVADVVGGVPIDASLRAPSAPRASDDERDVPRGLSEALSTCMARAEGYLAQADCLTDERERQDARLNRVYRQLIGRLTGERRDAMVAAQRAWVRLQRSDGAVAESILDELGQVGNLQSVEHDARAIRQRADLLERYVEISAL